CDSRSPQERRPRVRQPAPRPQPAALSVQHSKSSPAAGPVELTICRKLGARSNYTLRLWVQPRAQGGVTSDSTNSAIKRCDRVTRRQGSGSRVRFQVRLRAFAQHLRRNEVLRAAVDAALNRNRNSHKEGASNELGPRRRQLENVQGPGAAE